MELFNIGPLELVFILILALVVLGPEGMLSAARKIGQAIAKIVRSPVWRDFIRTSQEIREMPTRFVREAGIEETLREVNDVNRQVRQEARAAVSSVQDELKTVNQESEVETTILPPKILPDSKSNSEVPPLE